MKTIEELTTLAPHHTTGGVWIEEAKVLSLDADLIRYQIQGNVDVALFYDSECDDADSEETFPYECTTAAPTSDPIKFDSSKTEMKVDTRSWHGDDDEE
jgi:hypothetical protein